MKKTLVVLGLVAGLVVAPVISAVQAQGPGGGGMGGRMRNSPKGRLSGLWRNLGELEKSRVPLTKAQAKRVVGLVRPWTSKPKMTDTQAKGLYMSMNAVLTTQQKNEMDKMGAMRRRTERGEREGGQGGQGGRRGGGPGGGNFDPAQMRAMMQKMAGFRKTMNPFYPPSKYSELKNMPDRMKDRMNRGYQGTRTMLTTLERKAA